MNIVELAKPLTHTDKPVWYGYHRTTQRAVG